MTHFFRYWLPFIFWAILIAYFSSRPDLKSGLPQDTDLVLRKLAHIAEYAVFAWFLFRVLRFSGKYKKSHALILAFIISIIYAASDEYHQVFVPGREGAVRDVITDAFGVFTSYVLINLFHKAQLDTFLLTGEN